jgi:hypothetical protein
LRYTQPIEGLSVVFYPHGVLREQRDESTVDDNIYDEQGNVVGVTVVGRTNDFVPRSPAEIYKTDDVAYGDANRKVSEGFTPLELADYCTSLTFSEATQGSYGGASLTLELPFADSLKLLGGVIAGSARHLRSDNPALTLRNLCTGGWLVIRQSVNGELVGRFFGQVTGVETRLEYLSNGAPLRAVSIVADNFYAGFMRNQLKQTMSRDDSIKEIEPSAVFQASDYTEGFLSSIKESFKAQAPADTLADVVRSLGGHKLPASLTRADVQGGYPLGFIIKVCDGSFDAMRKYGLKGADVDVIKGKIMTLYQGAFSNNITHHETIQQMFNAAPLLFEYFAVFVPMTARELSQVTKSRVVQRLGGVPLIIYRYKPVYPYAPPSKAGFKRLTRAKYNIESAVTSATDCEKFFGDMPPQDFGEGQSYLIDDKFITSLQCEVDEDERINFTFVEGAFSNAQGHALNYFRSNASPAINKVDVNRHGLRAVSMHTPFVSVDSDPDAIKAFNERAPNALAERLFHNIALGNTFTRGSFRVEHDVAEQHLINARASLLRVPVGNWVTFSLNISETDTVLFTCYVETAQTSMTADDTGIVTCVTVYGFTRGHIGVHAPEFDLSKYQAEELSLLITNEGVTNA